MRAVLPLMLVLTATRASAAQAQADYYARLGVTSATPLVKDRIVQPIEVKQGLAPSLALGLSLPIAPLYRVGLEGTLTSAGFHSTESGTKTDLGTLRTGSAMLGFEGPVWHGISWRAGAGLLQYWPADRSGIFLTGGTTRFLAGAGLDYRRLVLPRWDLMLSFRYDFHRFTTDELAARGFTGTEAVHRFSATLGLARSRR